jgi:hypothetical protein
MAVSGDLADMDVTSIISVNCNEMNQARLLIRHYGREASIFFADGNIVHMSLGSMEGEEVIHEVLDWKEGTFELEQGILSPTRSVTKSWSELLLSGMQHLDQQASPGVDQPLDEGFEVTDSSDSIPEGAITGDKKESIQAVLDEFVMSAPQVVSSSVNSMPDGACLAGFPNVETCQEPAAYSARALKEMQEAASKLEWGRIRSITIATGSFNLHNFVIADGKAYVGVEVPREVKPAIVEVAFDKFRNRIEEAMP